MNRAEHIIRDALAELGKLPRNGHIDAAECYLRDAAEVMENVHDCGECRCKTSHSRAHKYRDALAMVERHLGESMSADDIAKVIAYFMAVLQEKIETGRSPK